MRTYNGFFFAKKLDRIYRMYRNLCFCTPCSFFLVTEIKLNVDEIFNNIQFSQKI